MTNKEKEQKELNDKRKLRKKQIAQLKASNEMLENAKAAIIKRYGEGSDSAELLLAEIDEAKNQNLERAASYLRASQSEVESTEYNKVNPEEEKAYFDRLERLHKSDEELHTKNLSDLKEKKEGGMARHVEKPKSKLAEITEKLKKINSKSSKPETVEDNDIMTELPPEEIKAPISGKIELKPYEHTFDEEWENSGDETGKKEEKNADIKQETVKEAVMEPKKVKKPSVIQKTCKDFDPRDIPSYIQYDIIPLPSRGECYAHKKASIPVAYLTAADENLITARNLYENGSMIDIILERKILDKTIRVSDLCKGDRDAIAIWLRATAYGPEYPIVANYQGNEIESTINLSDIKFLDFNLVGDENGWFDYKTVGSGDVIKFKILSSGEENELVKKNTLAEDIIMRNTVVGYMDKSMDFINSTDKDNKDEVVEALKLVKNWCLDIGVDPTEVLSTTYSTYITDRMVAQTMSVNGETDREFVRGYIENMRAKDAIEYRKYISEHVPGVDLNISVPLPESLGGGSFDTFLSIGETIFINV